MFTNECRLALSPLTEISADTFDYSTNRRHCLNASPWVGGHSERHHQP
jgi:hypothetical protein